MKKIEKIKNIFSKNTKKNGKERCVFFKFFASMAFTFFAKERCVLCILLCSFEKNAAYFAFFYVL